MPCYIAFFNMRAFIGLIFLTISLSTLGQNYAGLIGEVRADTTKASQRFEYIEHLSTNDTLCISDLTLTFVNLWTVFGQESYPDKGNSFLNKGGFDSAEKVFREGIEADSTAKCANLQLKANEIYSDNYSVRTADYPF